MAEFSSWRPCSGCFHFLKRSWPTAGIKDRNLRKRLQKFFRISMLKSSNVPIGSKDLWFCPNAGSSSAPSLGSIAAEDSPRIGTTSTGESKKVKLQERRAVISSRRSLAACRPLGFLGRLRAPSRIGGHTRGTYGVGTYPGLHHRDGGPGVAAAERISGC